MDLPTYTNIWRIEKRLYKLYDFRLPMPLPVGTFGVAVGIFFVWAVLLSLLNAPFEFGNGWHLVLWVVPPGVITVLATRPVIEGKRLTELLISHARFFTEPKVMTRLAPEYEPGEVRVSVRVWHRHPDAGPLPLPGRRSGTDAEADAGTDAEAGRGRQAPPLYAADGSETEPERAGPLEDFYAPAEPVPADPEHDARAAAAHTPQHPETEDPGERVPAFASTGRPEGPTPGETTEAGPDGTAAHSHGHHVSTSTVHDEYQEAESPPHSTDPEPPGDRRSLGRKMLNYFGFALGNEQYERHEEHRQDEPHEHPEQHVQQGQYGEHGGHDAGADVAAPALATGTATHRALAATSGPQGRQDHEDSAGHTADFDPEPVFDTEEDEVRDREAWVNSLRSSSGHTPVGLSAQDAYAVGDTGPMPGREVAEAGARDGAGQRSGPARRLRGRAQGLRVSRELDERRTGNGRSDERSREHPAEQAPEHVRARGRALPSEPAEPSETPGTGAEATPSGPAEPAGSARAGGASGPRRRPHAAPWDLGRATAAEDPQEARPQEGRPQEGYADLSDYAARFAEASGRPAAEARPAPWLPPASGTPTEGPAPGTTPSDGHPTRDTDRDGGDERATAAASQDTEVAPESRRTGRSGQGSEDTDGEYREEGTRGSGGRPAAQAEPKPELELDHGTGEHDAIPLAPHEDPDAHGPEWAERMSVLDRHLSKADTPPPPRPKFADALGNGREPERSEGAGWFEDGKSHHPDRPRVGDRGNPVISARELRERGRGASEDPKTSGASEAVEPGGTAESAGIVEPAATPGAAVAAEPDGATGTGGGEPAGAVGTTAGTAGDAEPVESAASPSTEPTGPADSGTADAEERSAEAGAALAPAEASDAAAGGGTPAEPGAAVSADSVEPGGTTGAGTAEPGGGSTEAEAVTDPVETSGAPVGEGTSADPGTAGTAGVPGTADPGTAEPAGGAEPSAPGQPEDAGAGTDDPAPDADRSDAPPPKPPTQLDHGTGELASFAEVRRERSSSAGSAGPEAPHRRTADELARAEARALEERRRAAAARSEADRAPALTAEPRDGDGTRSAVEGRTSEEEHTAEGAASPAAGTAAPATDTSVPASEPAASTEPETPGAETPETARTPETGHTPGAARTDTGARSASAAHPRANPSLAALAREKRAAENRAADYAADHTDEAAGTDRYTAAGATVEPGHRDGAQHPSPGTGAPAEDQAHQEQGDQAPEAHDGVFHRVAQNARRLGQFFGQPAPGEEPGPEPEPEPKPELELDHGTGEQERLGDTPKGVPSHRPEERPEGAGSPDSGATRGWRRLARVVTGGSAPVDSDLPAGDAERLRAPLPGPRSLVVLGCTGGAGQSVTALMIGHTLAAHRDDRVVAVDVNPGPNGLSRRVGAQTPETLTALLANARGIEDYEQMRSYVSRASTGLDVVQTLDDPYVQTLDDRDYAQLAGLLGSFYGVALMDPAATGVARALPGADGLVLVAPASADAERAVSMTFEWLDGNGYSSLRANSVLVVNGVSKRSLPDVDAAERVARGRCRAIVRVPWDDHLSASYTRIDVASLRTATKRAHGALGGVLVRGLSD